MNVLRTRLAHSSRAARVVPQPIKSSVRLLSASQRQHAAPIVEWEQAEVDPQLQGYPQLPAVSHQRRSPRGWDDVQERRNFGEPVPEEHEVLTMGSYDVYKISGTYAIRELSIAAALFGLFFFGVYNITPERPAIARTYPHSGLIKELGGLEENKAREEATENADE